MRVVIDTNVLVSGLLSPFGGPAEIMRMIISGKLEVCYDARIIGEYEEVLNRSKFSIPNDCILDLLEYIKHSGCITAGDPLPEELPDKDDEPFLEIAIASKASYLITGNIRHYPLKLCQGVNVMNPSQFLKKH